MNNQTIYWLWIQQTIGFSSRKLERIVEAYTFAEDFYRAPLEEKMMTGDFPQRYAERLRDTSLESADRLMQRCRECGVDIVSYGDAQYPELLRNIPLPPAVLYVRGNAQLLTSSLCIGIVGTRSATQRGRKTAFRVSYDLARRGVCVVSGGAVGIDTMAHSGALQSGGKTICVLGCGHEAEYLMQNANLRRNIAARGAVISEYPPDTKPSRYTFPQRNRIISGLSRGVLVVEAGNHSGSLITATTALEQGRDVFAVPGDVTNYNACGTNLLIKDGAKPVTEAEDVLCEYKDIRIDPKRNELTEEDRRLLLYGFDAYIPAPENGERKQAARRSAPAAPKPEKERQQSAKKDAGSAAQFSGEAESERAPRALPDGLSPEAVSFLKALGSGVEHIDVIAEKTGLPVSAVHAAATELEMEDLIEALPGRRFRAV